MKSALQLAITVLALGGLLGAAASGATSLSDVPLKASVLAKPNVIFAMDDSGSMDSEVLIDGNYQGFFYGNYGSITQYPNGKPRDGSDKSDWNMYYLFPDGTGTGNRVYGDRSTSYGFGVPPTPEVAWTRTPGYNKLYYDTTKTYVPWSPAYVAGTTASYAAAVPGAALSHPALGSTTVPLNAILSTTATNWLFTFTAGMTIPTGATNISCNPWQPASANPSLPYVVTLSDAMCMAAVPYYPATFWNKETCTPDSGVTCVTNYDGATLKRYEIKPNNTFPSGRSYADEMQNFANWFTYYRKRRMMIGASMGSVLENMTGLRMGVVAFNGNSAPTMYDADVTDPANNRLAVIGRFYVAEGSGGTPTHATQKYIYNQFDTNTAIVQYACQRNATFFITDGYANDDTVSTPSYSSSTYGATAPYQSIFTNSLADHSLAEFTLQLRATTSPMAAGRLPLGPQNVENPDSNPNLHVNTYALTLGAKGTLWPNSVSPFVSAPTWPSPASNTPSMIDDLWHATINGRGQMYMASDSGSAYTAIRAGLLDILSQTGAQGGVGVGTVNLSTGDGFAYLGTYNPSGWTGDLTANAIDNTTGAIAATPTWSANTILTARDWTTRQIGSFDGSAAAVFSATGVGSLVNPGGNTWGVTSEVMNYLRGDRSLEGTKFRERTGLMGAVINAEPAISRTDSVAYVASGEGMLHAFDISAGADHGKELWAYVPHAVLPGIGQTTARAYTFFSQLDGTPVVTSTGTSSKLLVAGMGAAGRYFYALDVSTPRTNSEADLSWVKWEFPSAMDTTTQSKVGYSVGRPLVVNTSAGYRVVVTSGYNSSYDGKGRLFVIDPATGSLLKEFTTSAGALGAESGLAQVNGFLEDDGTVRYVYGGDLLGNVWRFDLDATSGAAPDLVAVLTGPTSLAQPVTAAPALTRIQGQRVLLVGTGRLLDVSDWGISNVQSFYAIADGTTLNPARSSLVKQTYTAGGNGTMTTQPVDWATQRGWYFDLPAGQQANTRPAFSYGNIVFTTNVDGVTDCSASSWLYAIDVLSGGQSPDLPYVALQISDTANASEALPVLTAQSPPPGGGGGGGGGGPPPPGNDCPGGVRSLIQTSDGKTVSICTSPKGGVQPGKNSWREIRR